MKHRDRSSNAKPSAADLMKVTGVLHDNSGPVANAYGDLILRWSLKILLPGRYLLRMH